MNFRLLRDEIDKGLKGENMGPAMGFNKLERYIGIRKRILSMIFGASGSGKSALLHSAFILNPYDDYVKDPHGIKFKVILFSMERSKVYILAKWMSRKIFLEQGVLIPLKVMLGWRGADKLTLDHLNLIDMYEDYFNELFEVVDIIEGAQNPTGIYKYVKKYAEANGKLEDLTEYKKVYIPDHPNEIVIVAEDHLGITKLEKGQSTKKEAIDKVSEYNQWFRDTLNYSPVTVSQITRNLSNPMFQKQDNIEPTMDDAKESGRPGEDSDNIISLFDPIRYKTKDVNYKVEKFIDAETGGNYFRSLKILKNTYGEDNIRVGMGFQGATGILKELPRSNTMETFDYDSLFNGSYFLNS